MADDTVEDGPSPVMRGAKRARGPRRDRGELLIEAGLALTSELSLARLLRRIVELAVRVTGARYGALGVLGEDGSIVQFLTVGVSERERRAIGELPKGRGILGVLIREGQVLRLRRIAEDPRSVGFPPHHPAMTSFLGGPIRAMGRVYGNLYLTDKQGAEEFDEGDERALRVLAAQAGVAIANAHLYEEGKRHEAWLEALAEVAGQILAGAELEAVLPRVAELARGLAGADSAAVVVPDEGGMLVVAAADGLGAERLRGLPIPRERSISGEVIRSGRTLVIEDASRDPRPYPRVTRLARMGPVTCVPLQAGGRSIGSLWVSNRRGRPVFTQEAVRVVESFARQTSVALESARTRRELSRLVLLEERERIARELHDGIIQSLFAVGMGLQGAALMISEEEARRRIEEAVGELDRVIRDLRGYIFGLRPGLLAERGLEESLRGLAREFEAASGLVTEVEVDPEVAVGLAPLASQLVQMAREGLSNVVRHAQARRCRLRLKGEGQAAVLSVEDDGVGFDPEQARSAGQGLRNLRERAEALGGGMRISSLPGRGTVVRIRLPR
ncbi:MAG TPA: GAF domain-containing sensor histidine kinase [Candidatus Dormibacteraeota bacterium]|nr:GAF domain-containing sensor histidine kinase [Candidatus Dormibacteraeota bacterium]